MESSTNLNDWQLDQNWQFDQISKHVILFDYQKEIIKESWQYYCYVYNRDVVDPELTKTKTKIFDVIRKRLSQWKT